MINKLTLLNNTVLDCLDERTETKIVKAFTEVGIKVLEADFGFVWLNSFSSQDWKLLYSSKNLPYQPLQPRQDGRNFKVIKNSKPDFIVDVTKTADAKYVSKYMKSFVIIPISYLDNAYGTIVFCFKNKEIFPREKRVLSVFLGNSIAQAITLHRTREESEKFKKTESLLGQEKLKLEFIANAAHEIRTPLAIMKGNVDLALADKGDLKTSREALKEINMEINRLSSILEDLEMIASKNKSFRQDTHHAPVQIISLIANTVERLEALSAKKKITIKFKSPKSEKLLIMGEEKYLEKLFLNIVKNAITYGKQNGQININMTQSKKKLEIRISDNGIGISAEDLPHIFERFYRGDKAHTGGGNHSGLGLAIAKWVAESHDGKIVAESILGKGSIFIITLPLL